MLLLAALLVANCATDNAARGFTAVGPVWPPSPQEPRVQFVGQFSSEMDLDIRPSFWQQMVSLTTGRADTSMVRPMAVAATSDGQIIFVGDPDAGCVHRYDLVKRRYKCLAAEDFAANMSPVGVTVVDDEWIVVTDSQHGSLYRAGIQDKLLQVFYVNENLQQPTGVFWNSATERLFVTDTAQQTVFEFDRSGNLKRNIGERGNGPGRFNFPTYVWADVENELLVTDSLNFRMQRFDANGNFLNAFGENGDQPGDFSRPKGVATDQFGHAYVVDALMHVVQIFSREGELLLAVGEQGQGEGQFWLPNDIFVTQDNTIFVADSYNKRVQVFRYVGPES